MNFETLSNDCPGKVVWKKETIDRCVFPNVATTSYNPPCREEICAPYKFIQNFIDNMGNDDGVLRQFIRRI